MVRLKVAILKYFQGRMVRHICALEDTVSLIPSLSTDRLEECRLPFKGAWRVDVDFSNRVSAGMSHSVALTAV
jgi:hypothetical protein